MVSLTIGNTKLELEKLTHSLKAKISGYLADNTDRSKMKMYILCNCKSVLYITVTTTLTGIRQYKADLDCKSPLTEGEINLSNLFTKITEFLTLNPKATKFLMDKDLNIFGVGKDNNDFTPYNLDTIQKVEANITNSFHYLHAVQTDDDDYFIYAFPDILVSVDKWTSTSYLNFLVKDYVESKFPVRDIKKLENKRIITLQAFSFVYYHIKSLLDVKTGYTYTLKANYDACSKMNFLPYIPADSCWWVEENNLDKLLINRLKNFLQTKNETITQKIKRVMKGKKLGNTEEDNILMKIPEIPEYFTHAFMQDDIMGLLWSDFVGEFVEWETGGRNFANNWDFDIFMNNIIIIPDSNIMTLRKDDIKFLGFDGAKFYLAIYSQTPGGELTKDEVDLKERINSFFFAKFGFPIEVVYEEFGDESCDTQTCTDLALLNNTEMIGE